jgi:hypothetical protein
LNKRRIIDFENSTFKLKENHKDYVKKLEEVESMKMSYLQRFLDYKKKLNKLKESISHASSGETIDSDSQVQFAKIKQKIFENQNYLSYISHTFPRPNT